MAATTTTLRPQKMLFKSGKQESAQERVMRCINNLITQADSLYDTIRPEPEKVGYMAAVSIGSKSEKVRRAMNEATVAIKAAGVESGGKLSSKDSREAFELIESKKYLIIDCLDRFANVYHDRFVQLGMGLPRIVKLSLIWLRDSLERFGDAVKSVAPQDDLRPQVDKLIEDSLKAVDDALVAYSSTSTK